MEGKDSDKMEKAKNAMERTRAYFDYLTLEMRLIGTTIPDTTFRLYGESFASPIMTAALSHMGTFFPEADHPMIEYAKGAKQAGCVHWVGMCDEEEFEAIMAAGAKTIRVVKPYKDEDKIFRQLSHAQELGALAVGMDIDHMLDDKGIRILQWEKKCRLKRPRCLKPIFRQRLCLLLLKGY